jgi:molecular chaperone GrpE
VRVVDKRKNQAESDPEVLAGSGVDDEAPSARLRHTVSKPASREGASSSQDEADPLVDAGLDSGEPGDSQTDARGASSAAVEAENNVEESHDYLDDLRRLQAEFDNFRKRTFRERQQLEARGKRQMVERLLPVLDNFERAIAHGEGGAGVELVFKELKSALEGEGLTEIEAEGKPFDPQVHEAVESVEDPDVDEATITQVYRRGFTFGDEVVRPAMVVVARPLDTPVEETQVEDADVAKGIGADAEGGGATSLGGAVGSA